MLNENNIRVLLSKMTDDINSNIKNIKKEFGSLEYTDYNNQSILHILVNYKYDEIKCFIAIKSLLQAGLSPNLESKYNYNFIQTALYAGYSEEFILQIINEALKYNLNINHIDSDKDTIMHTVIYSDEYLGEIEKIYDLLCSNGFNSCLKDGDSRNLLQAMTVQKQYSEDQIESFKKKFEERCSKHRKANRTTTDVINKQVKQEAIDFKETPILYGVGSAKGKENDMESMLKHYIDRYNSKVLGTTTEEEYQEFFSTDALKRRFEKIIVKEPTEDVLYQIVDKVIEDYCMKNRISFENENIRTQIVNIILNATQKNYRVYNDMVNNPDLAISIIDKAFAFAKDSEYITVEHFIEGFECCDRIYEPARELAIAKLKNLNPSIPKPIQKVLKIDFNKLVE